jgi:hypothetical protein
MNTRKKSWSVIATAILALVAIACSCNALSGILSKEPVTGLAGKWEDPDTKTVHTIAWQNGQYTVTSSINPDSGGYTITEQSWSNGVLHWTYCIPNGTCVSFDTISVSGDNLDTNWTSTNGGSGTVTLTRVR